MPCLFLLVPACSITKTRTLKLKNTNLQDTVQTKKEKNKVCLCILYAYKYDKITEKVINIRFNVFYFYIYKKKKILPTSSKFSKFGIKTFYYFIGVMKRN